MNAVLGMINQGVGLKDIWSMVDPSKVSTTQMAVIGSAA